MEMTQKQEILKWLEFIIKDSIFYNEHCCNNCIDIEDLRYLETLFSSYPDEHVFGTYDYNMLLTSMYIERLRLCSCGEPSDVIYMIKEILTDINASNEFEDIEKRETKWFNTENARFATGIYEFLLHILEDAGLLDEGGSIYSSHISEYGKVILAIMNKIPDDKLKLITN